MGFRWKRAENNRKHLIEKHDIIHLRVDFIRKIQQYRGERRPIVYTDCLLYTSMFPYHSSIPVTYSISTMKSPQMLISFFVTGGNEKDMPVK